MKDCIQLEIIIHGTKCPESKFIQGKFLVNLYDDTLWTDNIEEVLQAIKQSIEEVINTEDEEK